MDTLFANPEWKETQVCVEKYEKGILCQAVKTIQAVSNKYLIKFKCLKIVFRFFFNKKSKV